MIDWNRELGPITPRSFTGIVRNVLDAAEADRDALLKLGEPSELEEFARETQRRAPAAEMQYPGLATGDMLQLLRVLLDGAERRAATAITDREKSDQ